jgi:hypothetical protein
MARRIRLTDAQVHTLRRMYNGSRYFMRSDMEKGEHDKGSHRVNCPSIPVLFREGLVDWRNRSCRKFFCYQRSSILVLRETLMEFF